jgi:predicted nucleotidyltransferase
MAKRNELVELRHLTSREKAALSEFVSRLREKYADEVVLVVLFGSKVRGDFDEESDLDVLVVVESDGWRFHREISFIGSRASLEYDVNISPKALTQAHYRNLQELRTPFFESMQAEGVELWRRQGSEL